MASAWKPSAKCDYRHDYDAIFRDIKADKLPAMETYRHLAANDLFFLLCFGLARFDANVPFVVNACREVEEGPETNTLDLWAREHYKSTILTYAEVLQKIIRSPEERIGIFSHTRPVAKKFLRDIKITLEGNCILKSWFPDVFYAQPKKEAPKWSEDDGIYVKRLSQSKEATIEAWGLVDGQPVGAHYTHRVYDDVVTKSSVSSPEMIKKVKQAFEESESLGTTTGTMRVVGTHWHFADLYMDIRNGEYGDWHLRIKPAIDPQTKDPVFLSKNRLKELQRKQGKYVFSCQQLLSPIAEGDKELLEENVRWYRELPREVTKFILCDPASSKKKDSDLSAFLVVALDTFENIYLVDAVHEKMRLQERWEALRDLCLKHRPQRIGYEEYGLQSDREHFQHMQNHERIYLPRIEALGGKIKKEERIRWLAPILDNGQLFLPEHGIIRRGKNLVDDVIDQMKFFPYAKHDDFIDALSRIKDPNFRALAPADAWDDFGENVVSFQDAYLERTYDCI